MSTRKSPPTIATDLTPEFERQFGARRTAALTLDQARRQLERQNTLRTQGMTTAQALEDAEARHNNA